ncbi:hypothetical protein QHF84_32705 [Polyangium sp. y55x31]|nr:hypothetical protein [Polyangium sp. y55x31]
MVRVRESSPEQERLNAICPYFTMFPLSVPVKQLAGVASDAWVLDPFCGRGSTNYAARLLGLRSVGVDSNPVATAIAEGKLVDVSADDVETACAEILAGDTAATIPEGDFWALCYHPKTLAELCRLRSALLNDCRSPERKALRALILGILHGPRNKGAPGYLSNQMPRTYAAKPDYAIRFWTKNGLKPTYVDLLALVRRKARHYFASTPAGVPFRVYCEDSRTLKLATLEARFSVVVTSPPYFGMRTYVPDQWLRYWFMGGPPTTTYRQPSQLSHGSAIEFAEQLATVWTNVARACMPGARMMIRFGGIHDRRARPKDIMLDALHGTRCKLRILTVRSAGLSSRGKRQADQFKRTLRTPIEELDFYVRLEEPS